jgi:hypothetical protein
MATSYLESIAAMRCISLTQTFLHVLTFIILTPMYRKLAIFTAPSPITIGRNMNKSINYRERLPFYYGSNEARQTVG